MTLYHLHLNLIKRSDGGSACKAAAYRSGEEIKSEYTGNTYNYRNRYGIDYTVVLLPDNAPAEYADRRVLWNAVEHNEKQSNAQLAREIEFALPKELSFEEQKKLALEFIQEQFVSDGMIADVAFHHKVKMTSDNKYLCNADDTIMLDEAGKPIPVKKLRQDPSLGVPCNPHVHVLLPLRPIDESGKWETKKQKLYVCEKDGEQRNFTSQELKENPGWKKLYNYQDPSGKKSWHTKSYVEEHPEKELALVNRYPKCEQVMNPKVEKWNSPDMLLVWREAWAVKANEMFESLGMEERMDHRSYKDQGVDLIPTIHEGKAVTIAEKRLKEEYGQKIASGESAVLQHTEIRDLNNTIREHNREIRIIAEMKKLRDQMETIMAPVKERIAAFEQSIAEKLEHLRGEIISLTVKIRKGVDLKGKTDEQIVSNEAYIKDLAPVREEKIEEIQLERKTLENQLNATISLFSEKKREDLKDRIDALNSEISLLKENRKYAADAQKEVNRLKKASEITGKQIDQMKLKRKTRVEEYVSIEGQIPQDERLSVQMERLSIRSGIEKVYIEENGAQEFYLEADKIDKKMGCSISDLSLGQPTEAIAHKIKLS